MIERDLLADLGFRRSTGWTHEVWFYADFAGPFWAHYGEIAEWPDRAHVDVRGMDRREFFERFLRCLINPFEQYDEDYYDE
jgi:hypothetical protein